MPMITLATPLVATAVAVAFMLTWAMEFVQGRGLERRIDEAND